MSWDPAWSTYISNYRGSEDMLLYRARAGSLSGRVLVIYAHGFGASSGSDPYRNVSQAADDLRPIAALGYPVVVPDLGGVSTWGIDDTWDAIGDTVTYMNATYGTRTDKVGLGGESMGFLPVANYAWRSPATVACIFGRVPVVDLATFYSANLATFGGAIESAWGGAAAFTAGLPTHDPSHPDNVAQLTQFADRGKIWITTGDEFIAPGIGRQFCARTGWKLAEMPGDHAAGFTTPVADTTEFVARALNRFS